MRVLSEKDQNERENHYINYYVTNYDESLVYSDGFKGYGASKAVFFIISLGILKKVRLIVRFRDLYSIHS